MIIHAKSCDLIIWNFFSFVEYRGKPGKKPPMSPVKTEARKQCRINALARHYRLSGQKPRARKSLPLLASLASEALISTGSCQSLGYSPNLDSQVLLLKMPTMSLMLYLSFSVVEKRQHVVWSASHHHDMGPKMINLKGGNVYFVS